MMRLATISPCYNEEEVLENSVARLTTLFNDLIQQGHISADSMMVFVNELTSLCEASTWQATWDIKTP